MTSPIKMYRRNLYRTEDGLELYTEVWVAIHETPSYLYCVPEYDTGWFKHAKTENETLLQCAKRLKILKRIHRVGSRFAQDTMDAATLALIYRKRYQLACIKSTIEDIETFLA